MKIIVTCLISTIVLLSNVTAQDIILEASNLPIFIINTFGEEIPNEPKTSAHLGIIANDNGLPNTINDAYNEYDGNIGIEVRGNGTIKFDKVSYQFETRLADGENNNVSLLGMPEENDWILYAPYIDKSLLRNVLLYQLARDMGHYAPRTVFVELIINEEYKGIYVLMEKIKRDKDRVDVTKFTEENQEPSEGGFIVKIDSWWEDFRGWKSPAYLVDEQERISRYQYVYPKHTDITTAQKQYIENHITEFEDALYQSENATIQEAYESYLDIESFVDYFILNELSKNPDGYRLSTFLYKDADSVDGRIKMGPVWDYNYAFGNYWGNQDKYDDWEYDNDWWDITSRIPFWWEKFMEDEHFKEVLVERWGFWQAEILNCEYINKKIDDWVTELGEAPNRNFAQWQILGQDVEIDWNAGDTYEDEIQYLKSWTCGRIDWMDNELKETIEVTNQFDFNLYPNPTEGIFTIKVVADGFANNQLRVIDLLGRLHFEQDLAVMEGEQDILLNLGHLRSGTYIIHLSNDANSKSELLFIK